VTINRKWLGALLCAVAVGVAVASTAGAARQSTPGVTAHKITIGGTFPLTGPAALYKTIPAAEAAYFAYVNKAGGVNHRKITDLIVDDGYNPANTVPAVKDLVENKHVFGIVGSLGTAPGLATMSYLNQKQVPQVLLATGDAYWGMCSAKPFHPVSGVCSTPKPWTIGWQPDYPSEGYLYAQHILAHLASPKIGVLYQADAYGQNYLAGFNKGLKSHTSDIVDTESYDALTESFGDILTAIGKLKAAGANTVVLFSTPKPSIQSMVAMHALGWSPKTYLNNVSANRVFMLSAEASHATPSGVISTTYIQSQTVQKNLPGMKLAKRIIAATHDSDLITAFNNGDNNIVYGLSVAWTFVDALKHAGTTPTRASFMHALRTLNESAKNKNPFVYPGMVVKTAAKNPYPMQQLQFQRWNGTKHDWTAFGGVVASGH
jgi:branched-chain amino acid transport system substrate-binding protein